MDWASWGWMSVSLGLLGTQRIFLLDICKLVQGVSWMFWENWPVQYIPLVQLKMRKKAMAVGSLRHLVSISAVHLQLLALKYGSGQTSHTHHMERTSIHNERLSTKTDCSWLGEVADWRTWPTGVVEVSFNDIAGFPVSITNSTVVFPYRGSQDVITTHLLERSTRKGKVSSNSSLWQPQARYTADIWRRSVCDFCKLFGSTSHARGKNQLAGWHKSGMNFSS